MTTIQVQFQLSSDTLLKSLQQLSSEELAQLRQVTLDELMDTLEIAPLTLCVAQPALNTEY